MTASWASAGILGNDTMASPPELWIAMYNRFPEFAEKFEKLAECSLPEEFAAVPLGEDCGGSEAYKLLVRRNFCPARLNVQVWGDVVKYLNTLRTDIAADLRGEKSHQSVTQSDEYQYLLYFLISAERAAQAVDQQASQVSQTPDSGQAVSRAQSLAKIADLARGLQKLEFDIEQSVCQPQTADDAEFDSNPAIWLDIDSFNVSELCAPAMQPEETYFKSDLSAVQKAAISVVPHFERSVVAHSRKLRSMNPYYTTITGGSGEIRTIHCSKAKDEWSKYACKIEPHQWTFTSTYRKEGSAYASQVFASQYLAIAKNNGFLGVLPTTIKRQYVTNSDMNRVMRRETSGSAQALKAFLENTANGRSTQRILDLFGLQAESVTYEAAYPGYHYYVTVRPK